MAVQRERGARLSRCVDCGANISNLFALFATFMLAKKVIENWLYWIIIDAVSIYIYIQKGFYLTAILFVIYTILAIVAYITWKKELNINANFNT